MAVSSPSSNYSIPPPWYNLHTSPTTHEPYITLPSTPYRPSIFITALHPADAPAMQSILNTPSVNDALVAVPTPYTRADADEWIQYQRTDTTGTACLPLQALRTNDPETGTFIGCVSLTPVAAEDHYELGYYVSPAWQRRGIVRDAVRAVVAWGVREIGIREVEIKVLTENVGSTNLVKSVEGWEVAAETREMHWPESKGGGMKKYETWRMKFSKE